MDVKSYTDEQLQSLLKDIHKELDQRKMERIKLAKEQIKKLATDAGIAVTFADAKVQKRRTKKSPTDIQTVTNNAEIKSKEPEEIMS